MMGEDVFGGFCDDPTVEGRADAAGKVLFNLVHGVVIRLGGTDDHFEELSSDVVFLLMDEILDNGIRDFESVKRFTFVVVRHRFLNLLRATGRYHERLERLAERAGSTAADQEIRAEAAGVLELVAELDPAVHDLLRLRLIEGKSFGEIAAELGIAEGTARTRGYRAIRKARKILGLPDSPRGM